MTVNPGFPRQTNAQTVIMALLLAIPFAWIGGCNAWSGARSIETLWDEAVDLEIANGLAESPLVGSEPIDPSQFRLPMYATAVAEWFSARDDLMTARRVSVLAMVLTIFVSSALAGLLFDSWTGLLTAALLSLSPYFLAFGRIAMTEGDIFAALFATVSIFAYVIYLRRPTPTNWIVAAVVLGLAVGTKLFCLFLLPVFGVLSQTTYSEPTFLFSRDPNDVKRLRKILYIGFGLVALTLALAYLRDMRVDVEGVQKIAAIWGIVAKIGWGIVFLIWVGVIVFVSMRSVIDTSLLGRFFSLVMFAGLTFFALMPVHVLQPAILKEVVIRTVSWDGSIPLALWDDHLRLYAGIVLLKSSIPVGVFTILAILNAFTSERREGRWRPCLFAVVFYIPLLCFLPLRQTFYLMPIFPAMMILTAAMMVSAARWAWSLGPSYGFVAMIVLMVTFGNLGLDSYHIRPDYHLYGYSMIGNRWLGAESRGYRNLIQTPSDGVESLINWCLVNAEPNDVVVSYLWEDRIVRRALGEEVLPFTIVHRGVTESDAEPPAQPSILDADYILLHINNFLGYGDRQPDHPPLEVLNAGFEKAVSIRRNDLEVAWIYRRRR